MTHTVDLSDFNFAGFWRDSDYARKTYIQPPPSNDSIAEVENRLGVKLPKAYITLAKNQNGGIPHRTAYATSQPTSWAEDHIAITAIVAIGLDSYALCGESGQQLWIEEWGYPEGFVYFAHCPSAGHDMVALDYRECGPRGEPSVVHIDQEDDYEITPVAANFADFIRGLQDIETF